MRAMMAVLVSMLLLVGAVPAEAANDWGCIFFGTCGVPSSPPAPPVPPPPPPAPLVSACRANLGGTYAVSFGGALENGTLYSALGVLVLEPDGGFRLKTHSVFVGGGGIWNDHTSYWAWVGGTGCTLLTNAVPDIPTPFTVTVSADGDSIVLIVGAASGTGFRQ